MISLIVIDLDGTLIRSDLSIGERTMDALRRAQARGIKITFATGRMIAACVKYADIVGVDIPMVALNGALVRMHSNGNEIFHKPIETECFESMLPILEKSKASITIVRGDEAFGWNIDDDLRKKLSSWIVNIRDIAPDSSPREPTIAMVAGDTEYVRETAEKIRALDMDKIQLFLFPSMRYYPLWYLEVRAHDVHKGAGVRALRKAHKIAKQEVLTIGDFINDLPMFAEAGFSAAVANAHEDVIKAADYVSPLSCDMDAVGEIIETIVLK